jgi:phosphate transport system ATP-binding protein
MPTSPIPTKDVILSGIKPVIEPINIQPTDPIITVENFSFFYGAKKALHEISMKFEPKKITAIIGPSGCGKSTLLRSFNRMNDLIDEIKYSGKILYKNENILGANFDVVNLRKKIGMVFQKPNPFPKSIYENILYGPKLNGIKEKAAQVELAEKLLKKVGLWHEVKDRIHQSALALSGGQQQRLCIARALSVNPDILLMDEPCSALDPVATATIEDLMQQLMHETTIVIVTHNMQQAARVSQKTAFLMVNSGSGHLVEFDDTEKIFSNPSHKQTSDYITGRFG